MKALYTLKIDCHELYKSKFIDTHTHTYPPALIFLSCFNSLFNGHHDLSEAGSSFVSVCMQRQIFLYENQ